MTRYHSFLCASLLSTIALLFFIMPRSELYSSRVCDSLTSNFSTPYSSFKFSNASVTPGEKISCENLFKLIDLPFPAMLIDTDSMDEIQNNTCYIPSEPINIAVSIDLLSSVNSADYPEFNIIFFEDVVSNNYLKFFGEEKRAIPRIETVKHGNMTIPKNVDLFKEYWKRSKLLECVGEDMKRNESGTKLPLPYAIDVLAELRDLLVSFGMFPFLVEGTFLGWYRECGVIPHTHDMDFGVLADQNNPKLLEALEKSKTDFKITRRFGKPESGYEFTLRPKFASFPIDLFFMYNNGKNESWIGGTGGNGQKYQFVFPLNFDPFCAAELYGQLFWISCHTETIMKTEYGPDWRKDHPSSKFSWHSSQKNSRKADKWNSKEMKEVYILY